MQTAKLFKNGRSQAVRLPKEFRFEGEEVYVRREGNSIVLSPKIKPKPKENPWKDFFAALDMFDPRFPLERHQPKEQQVRKSVEELFSPARRRTKRSK
jgi:antitoxin VapB